MINKRKRNIFIKFIVVFIILTVFTIFSKTNSKYESSFESEGKLEIAFYLLQDDYQTMDIKLSSIEPREEPYVYEFSISNNDGQNRTETLLEYNLQITATTNLPLEYELYLNEKYNDDNATSIINERIEQDEDGMYLKKMVTTTENFGYKSDETNYYQLVIYFAEEYNTIEYKNIIEGIEIQIDSKQVI